MAVVSPVIFPAVVTRKVNVSFVGQAYPGIQLSANEKKNGGSICSAQELRNCLGWLGGEGQGKYATPEKGLSRPEFFKISLLCRIKRGPFKPAYELGWLTLPPPVSFSSFSAL